MLGSSILEIVEKLSSSDGLTEKYLLKTEGSTPSETFEMVLMSFKNRFTACISTQLGCAMGCVFCATGQMGFSRNLSASEIVGQVSLAKSLLEDRGEDLRNIVLMGMGEPLHNYETVMEALDDISDQRGLAIAPKFITISTVGLPKRIRQLADEKRPYRLAVSLHASNDEDRRALVPVAKKWSLNEVLDACRYYVATKRRRIFFEWALIQGENDSEEIAHELAQLISGIESTVNLIPLNPTQAYSGAASSQEGAAAFQKVLLGYGIRSTIRQRRGIDVSAGCGQLRNANN